MEQAEFADLTKSQVNLTGGLEQITFKNRTTSDRNCQALGLLYPVTGLGYPGKAWNYEHGLGLKAVH